MRDNNSGWLFLIALVALLYFGTQQQGCDLGGSQADTFIVLHEGTKDDATFSKLAKTIQDQESTVGKAIVDAGWQVFVLDDDAEDKNDQPLPLLVSLGVYGTITDAHHELLSVAGGKLLNRETLPADATGESVLAKMQARGRHK